MKMLFAFLCLLITMSSAQTAEPDGTQEVADTTNLPESALTCNAWVNHHGVTTDGPDEECIGLLDKCVSYSYTMDAAGSTMAVNSGGCGSANSCATLKTAAEASGAIISDWKCAVCDGDLCNTKNVSEGDTPAGEPGKIFHFVHPAGGEAPGNCVRWTFTEDCTIEQLTNVGLSLFTLGDCPVSFMTECSMSAKVASDDVVMTYPSMADAEFARAIGCGMLIQSLMTKDCDGCTKQTYYLENGDTLESGPTCSSEECPICDACPDGFFPVDEMDANGCNTCGCQEVHCPENWDFNTDIWTSECGCATSISGCRTCLNEYSCATCYDGYTLVTTMQGALSWDSCQLDDSICDVCEGSEFLSDKVIDNKCEVDEEDPNVCEDMTLPGGLQFTNNFGCEVSDPSITQEMCDTVGGQFTPRTCQDDISIVAAAECPDKIFYVKNFSPECCNKPVLDPEIVTYSTVSESGTCQELTFDDNTCDGGLSTTKLSDSLSEQGWSLGLCTQTATCSSTIQNMMDGLSDLYGHFCTNGVSDITSNLYCEESSSDPEPGSEMATFIQNLDPKDTDGIDVCMQIAFDKTNCAVSVLAEAGDLPITEGTCESSTVCSDALTNKVNQEDMEDAMNDIGSICLNGASDVTLSYFCGSAAATLSKVTFSMSISMTATQVEEKMPELEESVADTFDVPVSKVSIKVASARRRMLSETTKLDVEILDVEEAKATDILEDVNFATDFAETVSAKTGIEGVTVSDVTKPQFTPNAVKNTGDDSGDGVNIAAAIIFPILVVVLCIVAGVYYMMYAGDKGKHKFGDTEMTGTSV